MLNLIAAIDEFKDAWAAIGRIAPEQLTSREEEAVAGYAQVVELVFASWSEITLTENHISRDLLKYSSKDQCHCGAYKTLDNHVEAFGPEGESLVVVAIFVVVFLEIYPFQDGNGRLSRFTGYPGGFRWGGHPHGGFHRPVGIGPSAVRPKPRINLTRYHGVLAPNHRWRGWVTPTGRGKERKKAANAEPRTPAESHAAMSWAQLSDFFTRDWRKL